MLALAALLASLELTVTNLALPMIGADLTASSTQLLWVVDVYSFLLASSLVVMGVLGDRIGRRFVLLVGAVAYSLASVAAAYSATIEVLIISRALMGIAGATLMPSTLALAAELFPEPGRRATAISVVIASVSAGTAIGPLAGGAVLELFWWGAAFLLPVPVMALLVALGPALLPERRSHEAVSLDWLSALLAVAAVLPTVYGLKRIAAGDVDAVAGGAVMCGLLLGVAFAARQRHRRPPFIDLSLFRDRPFAVAILALGAGIFVLWGSNWAIAQHLQLVEGLSPLTAGLFTAPPAMGVIVSSLIAPRLSRLVTPTALIGTGMLVSAAGYLVLAHVSGPGNVALVVAGSVIVASGLGPMMTLATDLAIGSAPDKQAGAASAIASAAPQLGGALGVAVLGSVLTIVYRNQSGAFTVGLSAEHAEAMREGIHSVTAVAHGAPAAVAERLLVSSRAAYVEGFQVLVVVAAVIMLLVAFVILTTLHSGVRPPVSAGAREER